MSSSNDRIIQFDALRVLAAFAVVWLHTSAQRFYICYPSVEWNARNFYDSSVRWAVPIFIMISGAIFLDSKKKLDLKILYSKYINRIAIIFIFWSIIYSFYGGIREKGFLDLVVRIVQGPFHFWFIKMLIGLYITIPILRIIVTDRKMEQYFICLSLATVFFIPLVSIFMGYISDTARYFVENYNEEFGIKIALGHVGYFVLGHYLANNNTTYTVKRIICILGIMSILAVSILTFLISGRVGRPYLFFYEYNNVFTLFEAISIFIVIKDIKVMPKHCAFLTNVSKLSLGIYIIHPLVMNMLFDYGNIDSASSNPIYFIPLYSLIVFMISYFVSSVLIKIPIIKNFMM